jgi:hypothetical protein
MKRIVLAALSLAALGATAAEPPAPGKYSGGYDLQSRTGVSHVSVVLDVKEVAKDKVSGTVAMNGTGGCDGDYPMEGRYLNDELSLKSTKKSGRAGDCAFSMKVKPEGDSLVGKTGGGRDLTLKKK